ncbi:hypothetical protein J4447_00125 [Candidatus Pacearchaeota archaeon]|nr:hypothetical protein [Candidatus Pacearchaeota archaeon]
MSNIINFSKKGEMNVLVKILLIIVFIIIALGGLYLLLKKLTAGAEGY